MILPDLNVLLYAYNPHVAQYDRALAWWEAVLNSDELVVFPHEVLFGFVRIASNPRLGKAAVPVSQEMKAPCAGAAVSSHHQEYLFHLLKSA